MRLARGFPFRQYAAGPHPPLTHTIFEPRDARKEAEYSPRPKLAHSTGMSQMYHFQLTDVKAVPKSAVRACYMFADER